MPKATQLLLCGSKILSTWELGRSKSACFVLDFFFCFTHTCTQIWILILEHTTLKKCSFSVASETELNHFQRKLCSHTVKLCGKIHCSRWPMFYFWALVDPLNSPNLILGVPREKRAGYWWWFIILWTGRPRNRRQMGSIVHLWEYAPLFYTGCES